MFHRVVQPLGAAALVAMPPIPDLRHIEDISSHRTGEISTPTLLRISRRPHYTQTLALLGLATSCPAMLQLPTLLDRAPLLLSLYRT